MFSVSLQNLSKGEFSQLAELARAARIGLLFKIVCLAHELYCLLFWLTLSMEGILEECFSNKRWHISVRQDTILYECVLLCFWGVIWSFVTRVEHYMI